MRTRILGAIVVLLLAGAGYAFSETGSKKLRAFLTGYEEVGPQIGAISTTGNGTFTARLSDDESSIDYELTYGDLEGTVTQAHIHFGQKSTTGGISVWLCQTAGTPAPAAVAGTTPMCPIPGGTVTGTLTKESVIGPAGAGIEPGAFEELIAAIRAGRTYVNVHSTKWGSGEIRAQIDHRGRHDD